MSQPHLTVSILVHHDFSNIHDALRSLFDSTETPFVVHTIVNAGSVAEIDKLKRDFPQITISVNPAPLGFAANHNQVMRLAETPYVALLNDDIVLQGNALDQLVAYLEDHADVGLVGPQLIWPDGSPQVSVYSDPSLPRMLYKISGLASLTHQKSGLRRLIARLGLLNSVESLQFASAPRPVPVIKGAVMVVRKAAYEQAGLMDEATRAYGEEIDWHWRLRQAGWTLVTVPAARVVHYGMGQAQLSLRGWQIREDRKAILNYYLKHRPAWQAAIIRLAIIISHTFWGTFRLILLQLDRAAAHYGAVKVGAAYKRQG